MLVALLGVLKAWGAYIRLDPEYPAERLQLMLADAQALVTVTESALVEKLGTRDTMQLVCLDSDWNRIAVESQSNPKTEVEPENLAYVIYTSGSTGKPKGVCIEQRQIVNYSDAVSKRLELNGDLNFALVSTI